MKLDRNLVLAGLGVLALGMIPALAQQVNPGASSASSVAVTSLPSTPAGTNVIGKTGIDQTTPGTSNKVSIGTDGTVAVGTALPPGANTIGAVNPNMLGATTTNGSSTVTTGGTFQSALAASTTRKGCTIQNPVNATEPLYVYFGSGTASIANSISLNPSGITSCLIGGNYVEQGAIQIAAATTGHAYVLNSQ